MQNEDYAAGSCAISPVAFLFKIVDTICLLFQKFIVIENVDVI